MPLVKGICPNCGGILEVDKEKDAAICKYCGTPFIIEKAITNYKTVNNNYNDIHDSTVNIYGREDNKNVDYYLNRAKACIVAGYIKDACDCLKEAKIQDPSNGEVAFYLCMYVDNGGAKGYSEKYLEIQSWEKEWIEKDKANNLKKYFIGFFGYKEQWWDRKRCDYAVYNNYLPHFMNWISSSGDWMPIEKIEYILKLDKNKVINPYEYMTVVTYEGPSGRVSIYDLAIYGHSILPSKTMGYCEYRNINVNSQVVQLIQKYYPIREKISMKICPSCGGKLGFFGKCKSCGKIW